MFRNKSFFDVRKTELRNSRSSSERKIALRSPIKLPGSTDTISAPIDANEASEIAAHHAKPSLDEQFHVVIDRQLKSAYATYQSAEKVALAVKERYPQLQVSVYDRGKGQYTIIARLETDPNPNKPASTGAAGATVKRSSIAARKS